MSEPNVSVTDHQLTLNGLELHYRDWGERHLDPIIVLHGLGAHARSWDQVAEGLADRFRIIVPDLRGHGLSSWPSDYAWHSFLEDTVNLMDALGLERYILCGHSLGGRIAYMLASHSPERIRRLVIAEAYPLEHEPGRTGSPPPQDIFPTIEDALAEAYRRQPDAKVNALHHEVEHGIKQLEDGKWTWRADPKLQSALWRGQLEPGPALEWQALAQVKCPLVLIYGSRYISFKRAAAVAQAMRDCQVIAIDASHDLPNDNPVALINALRAFLIEALK